MWSIWIAAACVSCGFAGAAAADETTHPSGLTQSTEVTREAGAVEIYQAVHRADGLAGPSQNRILFRLPPRAEARFSQFAQCRLARLQAFGPRACRRGSRVGRGAVSGSYLQEQVAGKLRLYNGERIGGRRTLLVHVQPKVGPTFISVAKWHRRARGGMELDLQFSQITTYQRELEISNFELSFGARFLRSPCGGRWTVTSFLATGEVVTSADATACG
jgi:hypothetical protein